MGYVVGCFEGTDVVDGANDVTGAFVVVGTPVVGVKVTTVGCYKMN